MKTFDRLFDNAEEINSDAADCWDAVAKAADNFYFSERDFRKALGAGWEGEELEKLKKNVREKFEELRQHFV